MRVSIKALLPVLFGLLALVSVGQAFIAIKAKDSINKDVDDIEAKALPGLVAIGHLNSAFGDIRVGQYAYLTSRNEEGRKASLSQLQEARSLLAKNRQEFEKHLVAKEERELYESYSKVADELRDMYESKVRPLYEAGNTDAAMQLFKGEAKRIYDQADALAERLVQTKIQQARQALDEAQATGDLASRVSYVALAVALVIALAAAAFAVVRIVKPIGRMTRFMEELAAGNTQHPVPDQGRGDEIGAMAAAVEVFKNGMIRNKALEAEAEQARLNAEAERKRSMVELADQFQAAVGTIVDTVSSAATEMQATARQLTSTAQETSAQAVSVSAAAEEAGTNVASVATAAEELGASVTEISRQVDRSTDQARAAVTDAESTAAIVRELSEAAARIGGIVEMISNIAAQTNLLALNATIEAARAGEAGRGFAVVAAEVKSLADQTAKATAEIGQQITSIQSATDRSVQAMVNVTGAIRTISDTSTAIASAVEQQGAATREIVQAVTHASSGTTEVSANITGVARAAEETGTGASQVLDASGELARQAETLRKEVHTFLATVRAA